LGLGQERLRENYYEKKTRWRNVAGLYKNPNNPTDGVEGGRRKTWGVASPEHHFDRETKWKPTERVNRGGPSHKADGRGVCRKIKGKKGGYGESRVRIRREKTFASGKIQFT